MLCYKEKLEPLHRAMANFQEVTALHDFRCLYVTSSSLTPLIYICHVLVRCFGSLLLQDMLLSLQVFDFERKNMIFIVNVLLACIFPKCEAMLGRD